MRRPAPALPLLLGAVWVLSLFAPLLSWRRALANRDVPLFHLPLRSSFRWLAQWGLPVWNPFLHGGQPILSNPNYAAFYPPSWLVLLVPPAYALNLLVILHAALAFGGAWCLVRRLGGGRQAAALAAVGFAGCGAFLSLLSAFNFYCGMAWLPWLLLWGDAALRDRDAPGPGPVPAREWLRPALLAGAALACQLLSGEPVAAVVGGVALLALAISSLRRPRLLWRALVPFLVALALSAVQLLPALDRLADSPRSRGLAAAQATTWSTPPARLVELAFPRFFGDPARGQEGLYFGWNLNDRDYPYVASLYPGLLLLLLGLAALLRGPIPRRGAWAFAVAAGLFLALGRFNPLYEAVRRVLPVLAVLRFPEKFVVLPAMVLGIAGALGWQRLLAEREAGRRAAADLPLALSLVVLATAAALTAVLYTLPGAALWFLRGHGAPGSSVSDLERGLYALRSEGWAAIATAAAVAALFALCRARWPKARVLSGLALGVLAVDLWHYGHGLAQIVPADLYSRPPALAEVARPAGSRLFVEEAAAEQRDYLPKQGDPQRVTAAVQLARLTPFSGLLWHIPYALHADYDLTLTSWGRTAMTVFATDWRQQPDLAYRFLGAWDVEEMLLRKPPERWLAELRGDPAALPVYAARNAYRLPRCRFPPRVTFHQTYPSALYVARTQGYAFDREENCVRPLGRPEIVRYEARPRILALSDRGGEIRLRFAGPSPSFLTVAETFDAGWKAAIDGAGLPVYATAACQLGVELPRGEHELVLRYRERLLLPGAAVSLIALFACALLLRRRAPGPAAPLA